MYNRGNGSLIPGLVQRSYDTPTNWGAVSNTSFYIAFNHHHSFIIIYIIKISYINHISPLAVIVRGRESAREREGERESKRELERVRES
jgi:hypothetical protein